MKVETCQFVLLSELLEGVRDDAQAQIVGEGFGISFGDANRTLVDADTIYDRIEEIAIPEDGNEDDLEWVEDEGGRPTAYELELVGKRIESLPDKAQTYVDLEN